ncbi:hypothetical protein [Actinoplanes sp. TFC3]|uniref:hypothetical protein n=1 Tax=Actinoplanes sp. TFC3 TaxID=1710355 RepID=UPI0008303353|nr:hypothetical protein [Actinoplanes sp. TFC3]
MTAPTWPHRIRQFHRWLAVAFTATVIATTIALAQQDPILWISYTPLLPLALLFISGAYLYVRPHLVRRSRRRPA